MDDGSSIGFWKIAVGILVTALFIGVIFLVARQGKSVANEKLEGVSNMLAEYQDESYAMYDGMEVTGAEVRDIIDRVKSKGENLCIRVFTKASTDATDYIMTASAEVTAKTFVATTGAAGETTVSDVKSATSYINPSAVFEGTVCRNANGVLIGLVFEQK